jgi:hypothetical protein
MMIEESKGSPLQNIEMTHYPREIARAIEIDKNFNLDRAIYTLSKFLSIEIETAILRLAGSIFSHFT